MNTIINENAITFKELEKEIFEYICQMGQELTREILESYDRHLMINRDKSVYRHKGLKTTTIKTLYGEVGYKRAVYRQTKEDGSLHYVFLLDEEMDICHTGLLSSNLMEKLLSGITEMSYRECADKISSMTGQSISTMGVWDAVQKVGEEVCREEKEKCREHKEGKLQGKIETPVLFEESDGVYLSLQGEDRKKTKEGKAELKVGIIYAGWKKSREGGYALADKTVVAGFMKSAEFRKSREAAIAESYNLDEVEVRILNGDGAGWIKNVTDKDTIFQLDPYHRNTAIKKKIGEIKSREEIHRLLNEKDIDGIFEYLDKYKKGLTEEQAIKEAEELIRYFENNREGLLPYQEQGVELKEHPKGYEYRNMGTMENHIWSIIAKRMKHGHRTWSINGGNHLSKILSKKCSGKLHELTEREEGKVFDREQTEVAKENILSSAKVQKKVGKGYGYPVLGHMVGLETATRGERRKLLTMAGF